MKIKLYPSIEALYQSSKQTLFRFPLTILSAIIAASIVIYMVEKNLDPDNAITAFKIMMTLILAVPLLTAGKLFIERQKAPIPAQTIIYLILFTVLIINYFLLPETNYPLEKDVYRYFLSGAAYGLLITFSAFTLKNEIQGFWKFNKTLIIKLASTALFTGVLYAGIAITLATIDYLFQIRIDGELYFEIWVFIAGVIAPWLFLNGYPSDFKKLDKTTTYHKSIRIFGQYILTPLVVTYSFILYLYSAKILISKEWPNGQITYLIIFFALAGIATNLILYPARQEKDQKWTILFEKGFYISLIPLLGMLFYSIHQRLVEYGITENRYYIVVLGIWLLAISLYFIFSKTKNIKYIFISLTAIILFSNYGPWSAYSFSEYSQATRLKHYLESNGMLTKNSDGTYTTHPAPEDIAPQDTREIINIIRYLGTTHGFEEIQPWFGKKFPQQTSGTSPYYTIQYIQNDVFNLTNSIPTSQSIYLHLQKDLPIEINGYKTLYNFNENLELSPQSPYKISFSPTTNTLTLTKKETQESISFDLKKFITEKIDSSQAYYSNLSIPASKFSIQGQSDSFRAKIIFDHISGITKSDNTVSISSPYISGMLLIDEL